MNIPISSMSTAEKLAAMEELWASLQRDPQPAEPPAWHAAVLTERQARIDAGQTTFSTLEEVRRRIESLRK